MHGRKHARANRDTEIIKQGMKVSLCEFGGLKKKKNILVGEITNIKFQYFMDLASYHLLLNSNECAH